MPADLGSGQLLLVLAIAVGAFAQSLSGFGFSLLATPICGLVLGPLQGIRIAASMAVMVDLAILSKDRRRLDAGVLVRLLVPSLAVMPLAVLASRTVPDEALLAVAAVATLACVALTGLPALARLTAPTPGTDRGWAWAGAASGAMGVTAGLAGPPIAIQALRTGRPVSQSRATMASFFLVIDAAAVLARGVPRPDGFMVALLAGGAFGYFGGLVASRAIPDRWVRTGVLVLAAGAASAALVRTVTG